MTLVFVFKHEQMVSGPNFTVIMVCIMLIKHLLECFMIVYVIFSAKCNSFKLNFPAHGYYLMPYKALSPINTVGTTLKAYCFSILQRSNFFFASTCYDRHEPNDTSYLYFYFTSTRRQKHVITTPAGLQYLDFHKYNLNG